MSQNVVNAYRFPPADIVYGTITGHGAYSANARVQKALGFTLSDTLWVTTFEVESFSSTGAFVMPVVFSENTGVVGQTGAANDVLGFYLDANWNGFQKDLTTFTSCGYVAGTNDSPRYITMLRQSATALQINVYTDEERTTHDSITCGGCCSGNSGILNIGIDSTVVSLAYIQSSDEQGADPPYNQPHIPYTATNIKVWNSTNDTSGSIDFHGIATGWTQIGTNVTIA